MYAYSGRALIVDLSNRKTTVEPIDENTARQYIGGSGFGANELYRRCSGGADPLGPDNVLVFSIGPLTGSPVPVSGRHHVTAKSPLTGIFGEGDVGGHWGLALRKAGFDAVIITGMSERPVHLVIGGRIDLLDAEDLWGLDTFSTDDALKDRYGDKAQVACIGPAGEKMVRIAAIMHDGRHARAAGRCGLGAVMGSKKLKAITVIPDSFPGGAPAYAERDGLARSAREWARRLARAMAGFSMYGTAGSITAIESVGDLPIRNWSMGKWAEGAHKLSGQEMAKTLLKGKFACGRCPVACGRVVELRDGQEGGGPEYETLAMFGANCLVDDLRAVVRANELANRYGIDTISAGAAIAFAMEAFEKGLIRREECDGIDLTWGSAEAVVALTEAIGRNEGLGAQLGRGVRSFAESLGPTASQFAVHVKGLELPAHDPRAYNGLGLQYATSNRGACHLAGFTHVMERSVTMPELGFTEVSDRFGTEGKGQLVARMEDLMGLYDSLKLCKFGLFGGITPKVALEWLNLATGWDMDLAEFVECGERIFTVKRLFNLACGVSAKDDTLPDRILHLPRHEGGAGDNLPPLEIMLRDYYRVRDWDANGRPSRERLAALGLAPASDNAPSFPEA